MSQKDVELTSVLYTDDCDFYIEDDDNFNDMTWSESRFYDYDSPDSCRLFSDDDEDHLQGRGMGLASAGLDLGAASTMATSSLFSLSCTDAGETLTNVS